MPTIEFPWGELGRVHEILVKLDKRAKKLGVEFTFNVSGAPTRFETKQVNWDGVKTTQVKQFGNVDYSTEVVNLSGWTLVGALTPLPNEDGKVSLYPTAVPGQELPKDVREWTQRCDHCNINRYRSETFIVRNDAGEIKQVGRQCIRDFLGHDATRMINMVNFGSAIGAMFDELDRSPRARDLLTLSTVLTITSRIVAVEGWTPRSAVFEDSDKVATATHVSNYLWATDKYWTQYRRENPITEADETAAEEIIELWKNTDLTSDYALNAQMIANAGVVPERGYGLAVSMLPVGKNVIAKREEKKNRLNEFYANVGDKVTVALTRKGPGRAMNDQFGSVLYTMHDAEGRSFTWFTTSEPEWLEDGKELTVKATVKAHREYQGYKQTTLTRVRLA